MRAGICVVCLVGCGGSSSAGFDGRVEQLGSHDLGACSVFATATGSRDDYTYWNLDISGASVDSLSDQYISSMGMTTHVHPDFGSDPGYGIPFVTVPGTQAKVAMAFDVADESDPGPYPYPPDAPVEASAD